MSFVRPRPGDSAISRSPFRSLSRSVSAAARRASSESRSATRASRAASARCSASTGAYRSPSRIWSFMWFRPGQKPRHHRTTIAGHSSLVSSWLVGETNGCAPSVRCSDACPASRMHRPQPAAAALQRFGMNSLSGIGWWVCSGTVTAAIASCRSLRTRNANRRCASTSDAAETRDPTRDSASSGIPGAKVHSSNEARRSLAGGWLVGRSRGSHSPIAIGQHPRHAVVLHDPQRVVESIADP